MPGPRAQHIVFPSSTAGRAVRARLAGILLYALCTLCTSPGAALAVEPPVTSPDKQPLYGPEPAAAASDLEKIRVELRAASERMARQDEELKALRQSVEDQRARSEARAKSLEEESAKIPATIDERVRRFFDDHPTIGAIRRGLTLSGFLQGDFQTRQSSDDQIDQGGQPLNQNRFLLRRARLRLAADYGFIAGLVEIDGNTVNGATARVLGAEATVRWPSPVAGEVPYVGLTAGQFKIPFGFEIGQSDKDRLFMERSTMERAMFPGEYDLGVKLAGGWRWVRYSAAVMNGHPVGEKAFPLRDPTSAKDIVGRVGGDFKLPSALHLAGGVSGLVGTGFNKGLPATKNVIVWQDQNNNGLVDANAAVNELTGIPGQAAVPSNNFDRFGLGADLQVSYKLPLLGELTVYGELVYAKNLDRALYVASPASGARDVRELGWYLAVTQEVTKWGMVGFRYDYYNPDRDSTDAQRGQPVPSDFSYSSFALAGALRYGDFARLSLEYEWNRNHNGRTSTGLPTNLADNAFLARAQVVF